MTFHVLKITMLKPNFDLTSNFLPAHRYCFTKNPSLHFALTDTPKRAILRGKPDTQEKPANSPWFSIKRARLDFSHSCSLPFLDKESGKCLQKTPEERCSHKDIGGQTLGPLWRVLRWYHVFLLACLYRLQVIFDLRIFVPQSIFIFFLN